MKKPNLYTPEQMAGKINKRNVHMSSCMSMCVPATMNVWRPCKDHSSVTGSTACCCSTDHCVCRNQQCISPLHCLTCYIGCQYLSTFVQSRLDGVWLCSWWRSIVVKTAGSAGVLSLSCATRLAAGRATSLRVKRPLSVSQQGRLSLPSLRGRLNEYRPKGGDALRPGR